MSSDWHDAGEVDVDLVDLLHHEDSEDHDGGTTHLDEFEDHDGIAWADFQDLQLSAAEIESIGDGPDLAGPGDPRLVVPHQLLSRVSDTMAMVRPMKQTTAMPVNQMRPPSMDQSLGAFQRVMRLVVMVFRVSMIFLAST